MDVRLCSPVLLTLSLPPPPLATPGFGLFHGLLLVVCGWANASDAVEILCVSFLLPTARCDLQLSSSDMGLLTASIFLGLAWLVIPNTFLSFQLGTLEFQSWRLFVVLCSIPSLSSALIFRLVMPESPKFLMEAGRVEEAVFVFRKMYNFNHRGNAKPFPVTELKISPTSEKGKIVANTKIQRISHRIRKVLEPIQKLFSDHLTSRSVLLLIIFFCISFGYYGLWMWFPELFKRIEDGGSPCANASQSSSSLQPANATCYPVKTEVYMEGFITAAANLPGNIFTIFMMDVVGGKVLLTFSLLLSGVSVFFIWAVQTKTQTLIMSCVFSAVSVIAWNALDVIGTELYPTQLRSSALGFFTGVGRVASILGNVVFGQLVDTNCAVPILLVAALLVIGGVAAIKLPRTKHAELT
ncbi:Synaptic vesicle glycoprotein 2C [Acipenser ruthenus]|uniref:Synaptic vesicle glycoprotein 2C n=1 Tax=Acipenser ruthenus TaxID=7906 RepID=A0A662YNL0_ACIRT|nr:Synaptic vesicle glycoprotein 2C [Acipenser ruthenus]